MSLEINTFIKDIHGLVNNPINGKLIKLVKHNESMNDVTLHLDIESYPVKVTTDFNKYCLAESVLDNLNINTFNMGMVFKDKQPKVILDEISKLLDVGFDKEEQIPFSDPFHIFKKFDGFTKVEINYSKLEKEFIKYIEQTKSSTIIDKIPKELLLNPIQISQLIMNEMKKVNRSRDYSHYVVSEPSNPYSIILRISRIILALIIIYNKISFNMIN